MTTTLSLSSLKKGASQKQQFERFSNCQVHLTETNDPIYVMGPGRVFNLSDPHRSKKLFIGPYDDGIECATRYRMAPPFAQRERPIGACQQMNFAASQTWRHKERIYE